MAAIAAISRNAQASLTAVLAAALLICYWPTITGTLGVLVNTGDAARAVLPLLAAAYAIWTCQEDFRNVEITPNARGIAVLMTAAVVAVIGTAGGSLTLLRVAFYLSLCGCIVVAGGVTVLRLLAFPLTLGLFLFPIPSPLFHALAAPLQNIASRGSELLLHLFGFYAIRTGNEIRLPSHIVVVSEACSGIQSLVTLAFFCLVYSYWNEQSNVVRGLLVVAAIPALMLSNIARVTTTGIIGEFRLEYTRGTWHEALGYVTLTLAFCLIWGVHTWIRNPRLRAARA